MATARTRLAITLSACACVLALLPISQAKAKAGPVVAKCGKFKKKSKKRFRACLKQNKANRIAFNQIKNSKFVGVRGDGAGVESFYCASGRFESRISDSYGTGVSEGRSWRVKGATVRQGGRWIDAFLAAPGGYEIALMRRGSQWKHGIASLGRILDPGDVTKTAAAECLSA
jgi:hypothetical protein